MSATKTVAGWAVVMVSTNGRAEHKARVVALAETKEQAKILATNISLAVNEATDRTVERPSFSLEVLERDAAKEKVTSFNVTAAAIQKARRTA